MFRSRFGLDMNVLSRETAEEINRLERDV